jgi:hypothetical protein
MCRITRLLLVGSVALLAGTASAALISAPQEKPADQKKPQNPPQPDNPQTPEAKPNQQPGLRVQTPGATPRPSPPSTPIADIVAYRGDKKSATVTSENIVSLNFEGVDYDAPVLATVNGEKIDQTTFRNRLILSQGFLELDQHLTYLLTKRRIEAASATGADPKQYLVSDDEVRKAYEEMKASIPNVMQGMKSEDWEKQVKDYMGLERYMEMLKVNLSFAKIFLPPVQKPVDSTGGTPDQPSSEPQGLPAYTKELLKPEQVETLDQQYKKGQDLPFIFRDSFIKEIKAELLKRAKLTYFFEGGLDNGVFMTVDGEPVFTEELWTLVSGRIKHADKELTLREAIISLAFDQDLRSKKSLLTTKDAQDLFRQHEATYENTFFPLSFVVQLKGFGSLHKYREYYARKCAFTKWLKDQNPGDAFEQALRAYYTDEPTKLFFEGGHVDCSIIFLSAWDNEQNRLKEGGVKGAVDRANQILDEYRAAERKAAESKAADGSPAPHPANSFAELVKKYSEMPDGTETRKGLLGPKTRYELRRCVGETEYLIYASDYSLAEEIFFCATPDDILGPVVRRVPEPATGVFLVKVNRYDHDTAVSFETKKEQVEQDYIDTQFLANAHRCYQAAKVELTTKKG